MSDVADPAVAAPRLGAVPSGRPGTAQFLLGQNARGMWVIRESTGKKAGVFVSREAALRFARLECADERFAVVSTNEELEFDYAA